MQPMKSEIQLLIAELEAEAELLQKELDLCLMDDNNYKGAHWFQKCLGLVKTKLRVLRQLENSNVEKGKELEWKIKALKIHTAELKRQFPAAFNQEMEIKYQHKIKALETYKQEIEKLPRPFHIDGEVLFTLLGRLADNKIHMVTIQLEKYRSHIYLTRLNVGLQIEVCTKDFDDKPVSLFRVKWSDLAGLDFVRTTGGASLQIPDFDHTMIDSVIEIISRLFYDVLHVRAGEQAKIVVD